MTNKEIIKQLIRTLDALESSTPLLANQGQPMDGFSALANFKMLARWAKNNAEKERQE